MSEWVSVLLYSKIWNNFISDLKIWKNNLISVDMENVSILKYVLKPVFACILEELLIKKDKI